MSQAKSIKVMKKLDRLMQMGDFATVNKILERVNPSPMPLRVALAFNTITNLVPPELLPSKETYRAKLAGALSCIGPGEGVIGV